MGKIEIDAKLEAMEKSCLASLYAAYRDPNWGDVEWLIGRIKILQAKVDLCEALHKDKVKQESRSDVEVTSTTHEMIKCCICEEEKEHTVKHYQDYDPVAICRTCGYKTVIEEPVF